MTMHMSGRLVALAIGAAFAAAPVAAQDQTFKITQVFPATHWHNTEGIEVFVKAVEELSGGRIKFEVYHAGQLGKEATTVVTSGLAEFGLLVPSYESAKLPLTTVTELPGLHRSSCEGTAMFWGIATEGGALYEAEYRGLGVRPIYGVVLAPYQVMTSKKQVTTLEDLAGLKIRAAGAAMDKTVRSLGATPVRVTSNELYDALTRGTVDGGFWPIGSTKVVGLENVFNYTVQGPQLGAGSTFFAIGEAAWQKLDDDTRRIVAEAGKRAQDNLCAYLDRMDAQVTNEMVKDGQVAVTTLPEAELARWNERVHAVAEDWAKEMDSTGRPGSALLNAYRAATGS